MNNKVSYENNIVGYDDSTIAKFYPICPALRLIPAFMNGGEIY